MLARRFWLPVRAILAIAGMLVMSCGGDMNPTALTATGGPVLAQGFEEPSGTTISDVSGNGNVGRMDSGVVRTTGGRFGNALIFNGNTLTVPNSASLSLSTGVTLEAWVNPTAVSSAGRDVIHKGNDYYLMATTESGSLPAGGGTFAGESSPTQTLGTTPLALNTWAHLAMTYDGVTLRFYVNGTQVSARARSGTISMSGNPVTIGSNPVFGQFFQGMIDEVRIYNRPLSAAEIQTDMSTPIGTR